MKQRPAIIVLAGVLVVVVAGLWGWTTMRSVLDPAPVDVPGQLVLELDEGGWIIFEDVGSFSQVGTISTSRSGPAQIDGISVVNIASGEAVAVSGMGNVSQTVKTGGDLYAGVGRFDVATSGTYSIDLSASEPTRAFVGPSLGGLFLDALPAVLLSIFGGVILLVGVVQWARASSRRSAPAPTGDSPAPSGPMPPPPGGPRPQEVSARTGMSASTRPLDRWARTGEASTSSDDC